MYILVKLFFIKIYFKFFKCVLFRNLFSVYIIKRQKRACLASQLILKLNISEYLLLSTYSQVFLSVNIFTTKKSLILAIQLCLKICTIAIKYCNYRQM